MAIDHLAKERKRAHERGFSRRMNEFMNLPLRERIYRVLSILVTVSLVFVFLLIAFFS